MKRALKRTCPWVLTVLAGLLLLVGCKPAPEPLTVTKSQPAAKVKALAEHLRHNDLAGFARDAAPEEDLQALDRAWREGRSNWPLSEFPLGERVPSLLSALSAPDAERQLNTTFDNQLARQERDLKAAIHTLSLFGKQFIQYQGDYSDPQRRYYAQVIDALDSWAQHAPLTDATRARAAVRAMVEATRDIGMKRDADLRQVGLLPSLLKLQPMAAALKSVFSSYGLDLDDSLEKLSTRLISEQGDTAQVEVHYPLGGHTITHVLQMKRQNGHWYPADVLAQADAVRKSAPEPPPPSSESAENTLAAVENSPQARAGDQDAKVAKP